ncbi:MAG: DUF4230 domain-containing protein [Bacteroidota bacterium]
MISLLFGNWRFVLDALLIIALVVLLFVLNPFGIFGGGLQLGTTTNMVTEIRQIGQLVTAEYYGEVISSLDESRLVLIEESNPQQQANRLYSEVKYALYDLHQYQQIPRDERKEEYLATNERQSGWRRAVLQNVSRNNILEKLEFLNLRDSLSGDPLYLPVIEFLWREKYDQSEKDDWNPNNRTEAEVLLNLYQELTTQHQADAGLAFQRYLDDGFAFTANFQEFTYLDQVSELSRVERKKRLALVGRGWVKAGFDFGQLDENSFYLDEKTGELHFFGLEPQILNADINPWFIPERAVPGFEIIDYQGRVNFKDAQRVKEHCIQKLTFYAHQANIINQAQQQGAETLKSFFSLITGKEIQQVYFHNNILTQTVKEIAEDEFINYYEGVLLDSLLAREARRADSLRRAVTNRTRNIQLATELDSIRRQSLRRLRKLNFEGSPQKFNYYSTLTYQIGLDSVVDQHEQKLLQQTRWNIHTTSDSNFINLSAYKAPWFWYEDSLALMMEYNAALSDLMNRDVLVGDTIVKRIPSSAFAESSDSSQVLLDFWVANDTATVNYLVADSLDSAFLFQQRYPFHYNLKALHEYLTADTLFSFLPSTEPDSINASQMGNTHFHVYDHQQQRTMSVALPPHLFFGKQILNQASSIQADSLEFVFQLIEKKPIMLTEKQQRELLTYYQFLQSSHQREQEKGAIIRASEWVRGKLTFLTDSTTPLDQFRKFIVPQN